MLFCLWLQRAQTAEAKTKEVLKHSQEQQAKLEELESELLSRPPLVGPFEAALQASVSDDSYTTRMQLLSQVLLMM